jgi:hypothetical protein
VELRVTLVATGLSEVQAIRKSARPKAVHSKNLKADTEQYMHPKVVRSRQASISRRQSAALTEEGK